MNRNSSVSIHGFIVSALLFVILLVTGLAVTWPVSASQETAIAKTESAPGTPADYTAGDCIACHQTGSGKSFLEIAVQDFYASVHGSEITCRDCHTGVVDDTHQKTPGAGAVDCTACHDQQNGHGLKGGEEDRPQCHDCHSRHDILPKTDPDSTVHPDHLPVTCAGCHPDALPGTGLLSRLSTFKIRSHNKADFGASYDMENCLGCHQGAAAHGETDPIDDQTCYRCHGGPEAAGAMWGYMHPKASLSAQPATYVAAAANLVLAVAVLVMLLRAFLDRIFDRIPGTSRR